MPGKIKFIPYYVQRGDGPHIDPLVYAADENENVFYSDVRLDKDGIKISETGVNQKFSLHVRWNIQGFGYVYSVADNGGMYYTLPHSGEDELNLNYELALSAVKRNERRISQFALDGWKPDAEVKGMQSIASEFLNDAKKADNEYRKGELAQKSLMYAHWAADYIELHKARYDIEINGTRSDFLYGCDARGFFQMDSDLFLERFTEVFNYATITHYWKADFIDFEPEEGKKQFEVRSKILKALKQKNIKVAGRPLFWTHFWVTPDWLRLKTFDQLLSYLEKHIKEVVGFYKDDISVWEVVNELHDWANELELNPEQSVELTKFACDVARSVNPKINLLINNCRPFGEYVQMRKYHDKPAKFRQRTPHQFIKDLVSAGVDFDTIGVQVYYAYYPASSAIQNIERFKEFGKKVQLSEVGCPSWGTKLEFCDPDIEDFSRVPFDWHRYWDEELQGDWLEYTFTYAYSQKFIEGANWYDFVDPYSFLKKGGILRSVKGEKKSAYNRLVELENKWNSININQKV
jgi:endo-1,4-beta-xylanase